MPFLKVTSTLFGAVETGRTRKTRIAAESYGFWSIGLDRRSGVVWGFQAGRGRAVGTPPGLVCLTAGHFCSAPAERRVPKIRGSRGTRFKGTQRKQSILF